jgi:hypothetical protein
MDTYMAEDLLSWRRQSIYSSNDDYVFASETMRGKQPYWPDNLMKRHIRPVAKANGIHKKIGWHTFRHSFGTLLKANGEDVKTVQELLRHANSRITLDVYTQAVNSNKRAAQSKVVKMMVSSEGTKAAIVGTTDSRKQAQNAGVGYPFDSPHPKGLCFAGRFLLARVNYLVASDRIDGDGLLRQAIEQLPAAA